MHMKKRLLRTMIYWGFMGACVVMGKWLINSILNRKPLSGGFFMEFTIGVGTFLALSLVSELKKIRKEK